MSTIQCLFGLRAFWSKRVAGLHDIFGTLQDDQRSHLQFVRYVRLTHSCCLKACKTAGPLTSGHQNISMCWSGVAFECTHPVVDSFNGPHGCRPEVLCCVLRHRFHRGIHLDCVLVRHAYAVASRCALFCPQALDACLSFTHDVR
jgi:hypothetical protein